MKKINTKHWFVIPALCYGLCLVFWLMGGFWSLGRDWIAKASGTLYQFELDANHFELVNMHQQETGEYISENSDPQMLWQNTDGITLRTLRMQVEFTGTPREMCLYYTNGPEEAFGLNKRVFAVQQNDGSYRFTLPAGKIAALRLDPCSPDENKPVEMKFEPFQMNETVPFWRHFAPGWAGAFRMLMYPGLAAAALSLAQQAGLWYKSKRNK